MNSKLLAVMDTGGRPIRFFITTGQVSDYNGAMALLSSLPEEEWLLADRGYDADWFRKALADRGTTATSFVRFASEMATENSILTEPQRRYAVSDETNGLFIFCFGNLPSAVTISVKSGSCTEIGSTICDRLLPHEAFVCADLSGDFSRR